MSEKYEETELNEFEYTAEEKAELARLDVLNEDSDELKTDPSPEDGLLAPVIDNKKQTELEEDPENPNFDDLELGDGLIDNLLKPEPEKAPEVEPEPAQDVEVEVEPAPNFDEQLEELEQEKQSAQGEVDDTVDKLEKLAEQFDEGEISQGKYDVEKLKLERELRRNEKAFDKAEQAHEELSSEATTKVEEYYDTRRTVWRNDLIGFLEDPANELIASNEHVAKQFDTLLTSMGQSGVFEGLNNQQVLQSVRNQLSFHVPELSKTIYAPQTKAKTATKPAKPTQKPNIPASLSQMQPKEMPSDDPFAFIRKLSGVAYEEAISKLSEEQQEALLYS